MAFGATRPFLFTTLQALGAKTRQEIDPHLVKEIPMASGDLVVLFPELNTALAHPYEARAEYDDLRRPPTEDEVVPQTFCGT